MFFYFYKLDLSSYLIVAFIIFLTNERTECKTTYEDEYDLCIIGAGFYGSAAARHASENSDKKICLIGLAEPTKEEYAERKIFSSHYDSSRIVAVLYPQATFQKLARKSISGYKELEKLSGKKLLKPVGCMYVGKRNIRLTKGLEDISSAAGTNYIDMSKKKLEEKYPFLKVKDDEYGIVDTDGSGLLKCREVIKAEMDVARQQECDIITDEVLQVGELQDDHHIIETARHGKIKAKRVLFTTGCFAYYSNFTVLPRLYIQVYRQLGTLVRVSEEEAQRLSTMPAIMYKRDDKDGGFYILPPAKFPDGKYYLKIGHMYYETGDGVQSLEEVVDWYHAKDKPGELQEMSKRLFEVIPDLKSEKLSPKLCVICETPTGFPYIHQLSPTVTVAVSGTGGASIAEEVGRLAAHLSLTGEWDSDIPKSFFEAVIRK